MKRRKQEPLFRKVNTQTHHVRHLVGGDFRSERQMEEPRSSMSQGKRRGLDYTPLFRFLLSRVGGDWTEIRREAVARLDRPDPIEWLVAPSREEGRPVVRTGESAYFSGLFVDEENILRVVAPEIGPETLEPSCGCCTHTLNGVPFTKPFRPSEGKP